MKIPKVKKASRMRAEHYADSRDEWKWSVANRQAREAGQSIFWVVMLRPFVGQRDHDRKPVTDALPEVTQFFAQERQHLVAGQPKSLARITQLCSSLGVELFADMEYYPATLGQWGRYFGIIVRALEARQPHLKHLVLLDPDNGIGVAKTKGEQVHETHFRTFGTIYGRAIPGGSFSLSTGSAIRTGLKCCVTGSASCSTYRCSRCARARGTTCVSIWWIADGGDPKRVDIKGTRIKSYESY
jgi:hypothetical protein